MKVADNDSDASQLTAALFFNDCPKDCRTKFCSAGLVL